MNKLEEQLNKIDHRDLDADRKFYDVRSLYESVDNKLTPEQKRDLEDTMRKNPNLTGGDITNIINGMVQKDDKNKNTMSEEFEDYGEDKYYCASYYGPELYALEDNLMTDDYEECKDFLWDNLNKGLYCQFKNTETGTEIRLDPDKIDDYYYDGEFDFGYNPFNESLNESNLVFPNGKPIQYKEFIIKQNNPDDVCVFDKNKELITSGLTSIEDAKKCIDGMPSVLDVEAHKPVNYKGYRIKMEYNGTWTIYRGSTYEGGHYDTVKDAMNAIDDADQHWEYALHETAEDTMRNIGAKVGKIGGTLGAEYLNATKGTKIDPEKAGNLMSKVSQTTYGWTGKVMDKSAQHQKNLMNKYKTAVKNNFKRTFGIKDESLNEELIKVPEEKQQEFEQLLDEYGWDIESKGSTWMGSIHYQVINPNIVIRSEEEWKERAGEELRPIIDAIDEFKEENDMSITWNFGVNKDYVMTAGIDLHDMWIEESYLRESVDYDLKYYCSAYYSRNWTGLEDDFSTNDLDQVKDWIWEKSNDGLYTTVYDTESGITSRIDPDDIINSEGEFDIDADGSYRTAYISHDLPESFEDTLGAAGTVAGGIVGGMADGPLPVGDVMGGKLGNMAGKAVGRVLDKTIGKKQEALKEEVESWTATDIVQDLYNKYPRVAFIDEYDKPNNRVALIFKLRGDVNGLEDLLDSYNVEYSIRNGKLCIIADEDEEYEECLTESDDGAWSYDEVLSFLKKYTNNFTGEDAIRTYYESEKDAAKQILKKYYKVVEVSDGRRGPGEEMCWVVSYAEPKNKSESFRLGESIQDPEFISDLPVGEEVSCPGQGKYRIAKKTKAKIILSPLDTSPDKYGLSPGDMTLFLNKGRTIPRIEMGKNGNWILWK